jgi:hypothetical protein
MHKYLSAVVGTLFIVTQSIAADEHLCSSPDSMALTSRGSVTDTPCVVPNQRLLFEGGYQYQNLINKETQSTIPQAQLSLGLPKNIEIFANMGSYHTQKFPHQSGMAGSNIGTKAEIYSTNTWVVSGQGYLTLPSGNANFGSKRAGTIINGIGAFALNSKTAISTMLGGSSLVEPINAGGSRYNSFNYSTVLGYSPKESINVFAEIFGQTHPSPGTSHVVRGDVGIIYSVSKSVSFDIEYAKHLAGSHNDFKNYIGAGITALFA